MLVPSWLPAPCLLAALILTTACTSTPNEEPPEEGSSLKEELLREEACLARDRRANTSQRGWERPGCPGP